MSGKVKKFGVLILVTSFLLFVWSYSPLGDFSKNFIRLPGVVPVYSWIFFSLLFLLLLVFHESIASTSWLRVAVYSASVSYLISLVALFIAELSVTAGEERLSNSFQTVGFGTFLVIQLVKTGIYAGWFYGLLGALAIKSIRKLSIR